MSSTITPEAALVATLAALAAVAFGSEAASAIRHLWAPLTGLL
jgi:hypothetical protein